MPQTHLRNIRPVIVKNLQQATQSVEAAVAWFTDEAIFDLLLQRLRNGVSVTLVPTSTRTQKDIRRLMWKTGFVGKS